MICPKCRKIYPDTVEVCPECQVELIGMMGDADAPDDNAKMERVVVGSDGEISPTIIYIPIDEPLPVSNSLPVTLMILAIIMLLASAVCFFLGRSGENSAQGASIMSFANYIIGFLN